MPTPPLPLFHNLLNQLDIPIKPTSLSSIPPSLLLLTLEKILKIRLPLTTPIRQCKTPSDELLLVKCLMGVMADDELGMDLSAVDPVRVVMGTKEEMGVIIMGLVVIAKRHGLPVYPQDTGLSDTSMGSLRSETGEERDIFDEDEEDYEHLRRPLAPDVTLSSPVMPQERLHDVFGATSHRRSRTLFDGDVAHHRQHERFRGNSDHQNDHSNEYTHETPLPRNGGYHPAPLAPTIDKVKDAEERRIHLRDFMAFEKVSTWQEGSQTISDSAGNSSGHRTVLQEMMDEFGLG